MHYPEIRHNWTLDEIEAVYTAPLPDLVFRAQTVHRAFHKADEVQGCMLLSIKTGGCPEDCAYCPQSAHYKTDVGRQDLVSLDELTDAATRAKEQGAVRFCMGAAWRDVPNNEKFERVLDMVRASGALVVTSADLVSRFFAVWTDAQKASHLRAAEVIARVASEGFGLLDAPPQRLNAKDTPVPYHPNLWLAHRPSAHAIAESARKVLRQ